MGRNRYIHSTSTSLVLLASAFPPFRFAAYDKVFADERTRTTLETKRM